jgi:hypothetical protein
MNIYVKAIHMGRFIFSGYSKAENAVRMVRIGGKRKKEDSYQDMASAISSNKAKRDGFSRCGFFLGDSQTSAPKGGSFDCGMWQA